MCDKVSLCTAGSRAYLGARAGTRKARGGRRTGAPGPAAWWGARPQRWRERRTLRERASQAGTRGPRAGARSLIPGAQSGLAAPGVGREAVAAALARARPPPSLPQRSQPSPGAAAVPIAGRDARGVAALDGPGGRLCAGERPAPSCRRNLSSGTRLAPSLPRAPAHSALRLRPFPSSLRPARLHFLLPFLLPFSLPSQAPARLPHGQFTAGRSELPAGPAPPRAGTRRGREAQGAQVEVPSGAPGAGVRNPWKGSGSALTAAGRYGKGAGHSSPSGPRLLRVARLREGGQVRWDRPVAVSSSQSRAGGRSEAPAHGTARQRT